MIAATAAVCAGFTYQGISGWDRTHGIRATVTIPAVPDVATGHIAGWAGVGEGDVWVQAGVHVRAGDGPGLYIETSTGTSRRVVEVGQARFGGRYPVEVRELARGRWSATIGGRRIVVNLPVREWRATVTGESYADEGCNTYGFRFSGLREFDGRGWRLWRRVYAVRDVGRVVRGRDSLAVEAR